MLSDADDSGDDHDDGGKLGKGKRKGYINHIVSILLPSSSLLYTVPKPLRQLKSGIQTIDAVLGS